MFFGDGSRLLDYSLTGSSLEEDLMWLSKFWQLITFYHLEASVTSENLIQGGTDTVDGQILIVNEESLLLTWVENDEPWSL